MTSYKCKGDVGGDTSDDGDSDPDGDGEPNELNTSSNHQMDQH
jgi:hypothetical protein